MLFVQLSDLHLHGPSGPGAYGDTFGTEAAVAAAVAEVNALDPRPEVVLLTGDIAALTGEAEDYEVAARVLSGLEIPVLPVPGNHDRREGMRRAFGHLGLWGDGFLCVRAEVGGLVLLGLDTLDEGRGEGLICADRLAWVEEALARDAGKPVVLFMHHPPFETGWPFADPIRAMGGDALEPLVARHGRVAAVLCGHLHRPILRSFGGTLGLCAPAVGRQGWAELREGFHHRWTDEPPAYAQHLWHQGRLSSFLVPLGAGAA